MTRAMFYLILLLIIVILWRRGRREKPYIKYGDYPPIWKNQNGETDYWRRYRLEGEREEDGNH